MAKSYSEYLQQNPNKAPRTQNPGASGLSYSEIVNNGLQGSLDNGSAYRQQMAAQRAAEQRDAEIQRYLRGYYNALGTHYNNVTADNGQKVTKHNGIYESGKVLENYQNQSGDIMNTIRNAYGNDSKVLDAVRSLNTANTDLTQAVRDYAAESSRYRMSQMGENPLADVQERIDRGDRLSREDIALLDENVSRRAGIPMDEPQQEQIVLNPLSGKDGVLEVARQIREADDRTPLERLRGETVDTTGITDTTIPGFDSYAERFGGNVPRQLTESLGVSQIQQNIAESGIRSESELSINPADNELAEKLFGRIDSVYRDASASADDLRFQQDIALGISRNSANDEWTRSMAREYYDLIESRLESTDAASYLTRRAADAMVDWANNYQTLADLSLGDASTGGSYSEGFRTLTQYAQSHPATYRSVMSDYVGGNRSSAQELADATGVSVSVVRAWQKANEASFMEYQADTAASGLSPWFKENIGDTVYQTASQIPSWALSAVLGGWPGLASGPSSVVDGIATGIQAARNATTVSAAASGFASAVGQGMLNAAAADPALWFSFGIGTMGRTVSQNAMERGYDPRNYLNGALMGFSEVFSENFSGFGTGNNPFTALTTPKGSRFLSVLTAMGNYLLTGAEEGLEELINVPMQNAFDNLTYGGKKLVGTGGIFDFQAMWDAGVSGAVMGAMLGSVGTLTNIASDILSDSTDVGSSAYIRDVVSNILNKPEFLSLEDGTTLDALDPRTADRDTILARVGELLEHKQTAMLQAVGESYIRSESLDELYDLADQMGADVQVLVEQARAQGSAVTPELVGEIALEVKGSEETSEAALPTIQPTVYTQELQREMERENELRERLSIQNIDENDTDVTASDFYRGATPAARAELNSLYEKEEADAARLGQEAPSKKVFANAYSLGYLRGRSSFNLSEEQRANRREAVIKEAGAEWAGRAFDLGVTEARAIQGGTVVNGKGKGGARELTANERRFFREGTIRNNIKLRGRQVQDVAAMDYIGKALGTTIVYFESVNDRTDNGFYDNRTGTIYVDINAGEGNNRSMIRTLAHEMTHMLEHTAKAEYASLREFVLNKYFDGNEDLFQQRIDDYLKNDSRLRPEDAVSELIADHCEMMLKDTSAIRQIYEQDRRLFDKIVGFINDVIKAITGAMKGIDPKSATAMDFAEDLDYWNEVHRLWNAAVLAASERHIEEITDTGISNETAIDMVDNGLTVEKGAIVSEDVAEVMEGNDFQPPIDDHDIQSSPRTTPAWETAFRKHFPNLTENEKQDIIDAIYAFNEDDIMQDAIGFAADSDPAGFFANSKFGPLRTNVEYKYTFDMDTSCPRTFQFLAYRDKIQSQIGRPLTYWESQNLLNVMRVTGQQIPCTYCYVENKRILLSASFNNYFKFRDAVMTAATYEDARRAMYGYNEKKDELPKASQTVLDKWWNDRSYNPTVSECYGAAMKSKNLINQVLDDARKNGTIKQSASLKSVREYIAKRYGITDKNALTQVKNIVTEWKYDVNAKREHKKDIEGITDTVDEKALSVLNEGMAYAKSASSAKNVENYMPYSGQLSNIPKAIKEFIQAMGGLRKHSSNDFRVDYVQDYFLLFADMAAGGWMGHTYTKSVDYVKIFGKTGDRINMSIALNGNTYDTITENSQEGMAWKDARELRDAYPNAGVMCMVTNDAQLSWALDQDWIDMIIPFHSSGLLKEVWSDIRQWMDYTTKQNESFWTTDEMLSQLRAANIDVDGVDDIKALYFEALGKTALLEVDEDGNVKYHRPHFFPDDTKIQLKTPSGTRTVTIPGHHNNAARYLELCNQYGVRPRFYNATVTYKGKQIRASEHPKFFKLIKETSRIDGENGTGPQEAIKFNFDEYDSYLGMTPFEYALQRMDEERKNGGFNNAGADPNGIVPRFIDNFVNVKNHNEYIDPATVPAFKTLMDIQKQGMDEWMQSDEEDSVQRSSRRSPLTTVDVVTAMQNYNGLSSQLADAAKRVKSLMRDYNANVREVENINKKLASDNVGDKKYIATQKRKLLAAREKILSNVDKAMESSGLREFAEAERTNISELLNERMGSAVNYINEYYNTPMQNALARERLNTEAANERTQRVREAANERLDRREAEWRDRYERLQRRYDSTKLRLWMEQAEMRRNFKEYVANRNEREAAKALRATVRRRVDRLATMVTTNTDRLHVVTELRSPVAQFLTLIDPTKQGNSKAAAASASQWSPVLNELLDIARPKNESEDTNTDSIILSAFEDDIAAFRDTVAQLVKENGDVVFTIDQMNSEQLAQLNRVILAVQALVNSTNRVFTNRRYQTVHQMIDASDRELKAIKGRSTIIPESSNLSKAELDLQKSLAWNNCTPYYAFKRFQGVGQELYNSVAEGWGQLARNSQECIDFSNATWSEREGRDWTNDVKTISFQDPSGEEHTVKMTVAQLMSLWCHNRQNQSKIHLFGRGFKIKTVDKLPNQDHIYKISQETVDEILTPIERGGKYITERQIEVASKIMDFMTKVGARFGNEVTRQLFGFDYFDANEPYFTIRSVDSEHGREPSDRQPSLFSLLHMSATRNRVENANSALVIDDIFSVFSSHMADMAKYNALALPILDMVNWINGRTSGEHTDSSTIRQDLDDVFGTGLASGYVTQFIRDMNGTYTDGDLAAKRFDKLLSRMKRAAVAASLRVVIQQPFSYVRAMYSISPKYILRSLIPTFDNKKNKEEAQKWSGLALSKAQGYFSTNVARSLQEKIANNTTLGDRILDRATALAGWADGITWGAIWKASKYKVENEGYEGKFLKKGSDEYFEAVAKVFNQIILSTQVMDGTLTRSPFMRDSSFYTKLMTMFMAEPTLSYNMVLDSFSEWKLSVRKGEGSRAALKRVGLAIATYALTQVANAAVTALIDGFRDDDDYETFWEKYLEHFKGNLAQNANPLEGIPTANMLWKVVQAAFLGKELPLGSEFQGITTTVKAIRAAYDSFRGEKTAANYYGNMTEWGVIYNLLAGASYIFGMPLANASKVITSTYNTVVTIYNDTIAPKSGRYLEHWKTYESGATGYDALYEAYVRGNEDRIESLSLELMAHGMTDEDIAKEIRKRVREDYLESAISEQKALEILAENGFDKDERTRLIYDWRFRRDSGMDDATSAMGNHYYSTFRNMGLSQESFAEYYRALSGAEAVRNSRGDVTKSLGDVRREYIRSLPVTATVKAALWHIWYDSDW